MMVGFYVYGDEHSGSIKQLLQKDMPNISSLRHTERVLVSCAAVSAGCAKFTVAFLSYCRSQHFSFSALLSQYRATAFV